MSTMSARSVTLFFFFQAEDGIRDLTVTGVQTCALPIWFGRGRSMTGVVLGWLVGTPGGWAITQLVGVLVVGLAVAGVRFGPARRGVATRRRSPLEHLEALAAGPESPARPDSAAAPPASGVA